MDQIFRTVETIIRQWVLREESARRLNATSLRGVVPSKAEAISNRRLLCRPSGSSQ